MDYKTKEEFIILLSKELKYLKKDEAEEVLKYYYNKINTDIEYGRSETATLENLPTPHEIAVEQYEKHGVNYLELRKKVLKRQAIFSKIINSILLLFVIVAELFLLYYLIRSDIRIINLGIKLLNNKNNLISFLTLIFISLTFIILIIYIIDLFIILSLNILVKIFDFKDTIKEKLLNFSINVKLEEKLKKKKPLLLVLIIVFIITLVFSITSFVSKGYLYRSINNKPLNEEIISLNNIKEINLKAKTMDVEIKTTTDNSYLIYNYEFNHENKKEIKEQILNLEYNDSEVFDIFNLLKEPSQKLIIYLNDNNLDKINLNLNNGNLTITDLNINNIELNSSVESHVILSKVKTKEATITGNKLYLGLTESELNNVNIKAKSGQEIIEKNTAIDNLILDGGTSLLKYTDSTIKKLDLTTNGSSSMNINNLELDEFKYKAYTSTLYLKNSIIKKLNCELFNTSTMNLEQVVVEETTTIEEKNNSYFTLNYFKSPLINLTATSSYLFLYDLNKDGSFDKYNSYHYDINLTINASGPISKTQMENSDIKDANITQARGYLIIKDSNFTNSTITLNQTTGVEYDNIDGEEMIMYIDRIEEYFRLNSNTVPSIHIDVRKCDALSYAYIVNKGNYDLVINLGKEE